MLGLDGRVVAGVYHFLFYTRCRAKSRGNFPWQAFQCWSARKALRPVLDSAERLRYDFSARLDCPWWSGGQDGLGDAFMGRGA